jgi:tricorn protease
MRSLLRFRTGVLGVAMLLGLNAAATTGGEVTFARHLALSPDGQTLAFSWAGDIWSVPVGGGRALRLTVHPGDDLHPVFSPDGTQVAFSSNRHGASNVFIMRADGTDLRRLTYMDVSEYPTDFSPDGAWIYLHSYREYAVYREPRLYRIPVAGGQPWRAVDCFGAFPQVSPDGTRLLFTRGSVPDGRRSYRGSANYDIFMHTLGTPEFAQLTTYDGNDEQPHWAADGTGVYFLSDRSGTVNVWYQPLDGSAARQITQMEVDDVRDLAVSADGGTLAFTHWDEIYVMPLPDGMAAPVAVTAGGDMQDTDLDLRTLTRGADEAEISPDREEVALVVHGEIYVIKTAEDKPTRRVTVSPARDKDVTWSPDGKALFFISDRAGQEDVYRATSAEDPPKALSDSLRFKIERVTDDEAIESAPRISPDGERLSVVRGLGDLVLRDLKTGAEAVLIESWNAPGYAWSPDSAWIAYQVEDTEHNADVWVVASDGTGTPVNVSQHPDFDGVPQWSADGQMLAFASRRHGFDTDLYVVFLSPELNEQSRVEFDEYFEQRSKAVGKLKPLKEAVASGDIVLAGQTPTTQPTATQPADAPDEAAPASTTQPATQPTTQPQTEEERLRALVSEILAEREKKDDKPKDEKKDDEQEEDDEDKQPAYELDTCWKRVRRVTSMVGDQSQFALAPDGQTLAFTSSHEGAAKLYTIKWDGSERKSIDSGAGGLRWGLQGKRLYYVQGGVPRSRTASGGGEKTYGFRAKLAVVHPEEAAQKFDDGARQLGMRFYHPTMKGLDWPALTRKYKELALTTHTQSEFNTVFNMLLGELNASHLGIYGPNRGGSREPIGRLGVRFDRDYAGPGLKVLAVIPKSPADRAESKLVPGDVIVKVDGHAVGPDAPLDVALIDTVGQEIIIAYNPSPDRDAMDAKGEGDGDADDENGASTQPTTDAATATQPAEPETCELVIRPTSSGAIRNLQYDAWVADNRAYVDEKSGGRVGYAHIRSMGQASFEVFERDLYAAAHGRDGLIIDVRNNGGGWTADWVLAVLNVRRHAYTIQRGGTAGYPQDRLIFYSWVKPATMMCNQHSFSNAEIVSHAFKNLGRGPLVGMTTHGGVISTGGYTLIDGALVRMPMRGWYTLPDRADMELHGAVPDVLVPVDPADEVRGRMPQLDAAIAATLEQIADEPAAE